MNLQYIEISRSALLHNLQIFRDIAPQSKLMAVVKSNAYGHGIKEVVHILKEKIDWFGVNNLEEANSIRSIDPSSSILVMGENGMGLLDHIPTFLEKDHHKGKVHLTLSCKESISNLTRNKHLSSLPFHLKVDTGLSRLGSSIEGFTSLMRFIQNRQHLFWTGIMTHLANVEDVTDQDYAQEQLESFRVVCQKALQIKANLICHAAASAATLLLPESRLDMIRVGISLYGLWPSDKTRLSLLLKSDKKKGNPELRPVLSWRSRIIHIHEVKSGNFVGYGATYRAEEDKKIAVLPSGYYEGYSRSLSGNSYVLIRSNRAPVLGRVSMNMISVDVSLIPQAQVGDMATLIGSDGSETITADFLADRSGTIHYEIVSRIHPQIPRIVVE